MGRSTISLNRCLFSWNAGILVLLIAAILALPAVANCDSLADAIEARNSERTAELLSGQIDVNAPQVDGMTALHWAAHHDDWELGIRQYEFRNSGNG